MVMVFLAQDVFAHVPLLAEDLARLRASKGTANSIIEVNETVSRRMPNPGKS